MMEGNYIAETCVFAGGGDLIADLHSEEMGWSESMVS